MQGRARAARDYFGCQTYGFRGAGSKGRCEESGARGAAGRGSLGPRRGAALALPAPPAPQTPGGGFKATTLRKTSAAGKSWRRGGAIAAALRKRLGGTEGRLVY